MESIFAGSWISGVEKVDVKLSLIAFVEDNAHIIYCPALDLSGYGTDEKEAMESFQVVLGEFLLYTTNKKTFFDALRKMGWQIKSKSKPFIPPSLSKLLDENENFSRIFNDHSFKKFDRKISIPAL
jgi:hypothetical protein